MECRRRRLSKTGEITFPAEWPQPALPIDDLKRAQATLIDTVLLGKSDAMTAAILEHACGVLLLDSFPPSLIILLEEVDDYRCRQPAGSLEVRVGFAESLLEFAERVSCIDIESDAY